ncbi:MAG: hypothetical protein AAF586_05325 [Planctomycetota bacterium]
MLTRMRHARRISNPLMLAGMLSGIFTGVLLVNYCPSFLYSNEQYAIIAELAEQT